MFSSFFVSLNKTINTEIDNEAPAINKREKTDRVQVPDRINSLTTPYRHFPMNS